jgi:hypothetical protein
MPDFESIDMNGVIELVQNNEKLIATLFSSMMTVVK